MIPTRYMVAGDIDLKQVVAEDKLASKESRKQMKIDVKKIFEDK